MLIAGLVLFALLVVIHELGHFLVARRNHVEVEEFGVGFPPRLFGKRLGRGIFQSYYSFNLLPLGGFVRLKGENESDKRKGSFGAAPFRVKAKITLAGVAMNYVVAVVLLSIVAAVRLPLLFDNQFSVASDTQEIRREVIVSAVLDSSPAQKAGLELGDSLISAAGETLKSGEQLSQITKEHAGQTIPVEVKKVDGSLQKLDVELDGAPEDGKSFLGVGPRDVVERRSTWSAPIVGFVVTNQLAAETLRLLGDMMSNLFRGDTAAAAAGVTGPVGIVAILREVDSVSQLLLITSVISLSLALMNTLPIPALDGGRLALSGLFKLLKRPLSAKVEDAVHGAGFVILIGLIILISIVDVKRFF